MERQSNAIASFQSLNLKHWSRHPICIHYNPES